MEYDHAGNPVLVLGGLSESAPQLVIGEVRPDWDHYVVDHRVHVIGDGLRAEQYVSFSSGGDGMAGFLSELSEDFRGWEGVRLWRSLEGQLTIEATWASRGHVTLRPTLRSRSWWTQPGWQATADLDVEAGAEMTALAAKAAEFFREVPG